jgi:hypothetical protein
MVKFQADRRSTAQELASRPVRPINHEAENSVLADRSLRLVFSKRLTSVVPGIDEPSRWDERRPKQ